VEALPFLTLRGRFDFVRGTNEQTGEPLPLMPPPRGDLEAELHTLGPQASGPARGSGRAYVNVGTELVARQDRLGPFDTPTGGYALLNLGAGLARELWGREFALDVRVRNVADARYTDFLSRYKLFAYGQGRNVIFRGSMRF
jgi:iron complex outermembrane receptor protein